MFLNELFDVWSNGCSVEAHHEQLALNGILLALSLAAR
jgi:hypothetical protein